jgi:hypothetical protein
MWNTVKPLVKKFDNSFKFVKYNTNVFIGKNLYK